MKRTAAGISIWILMFLLCACGKSEPAASVGEEASFAGAPIRSVESFNKTGKIQREDLYLYDSSGKAYVSKTVNYTYDEQGRLASVIVPGNGVDVDKYRENDQYRDGRLFERILYDDFGTVCEKFNWYYHPNGALQTEYHSVITNGQKTTEQSDYDTAGRLLTVSGDGWYRNTIYDELSGLPVREEKYTRASSPEEEDVLSSFTDYIYDDSARLSRQVTKTTVTVYNYDDAGHLTLETVFMPDDSSDDYLHSAVAYEYDDGGNMITKAETTFYGEDTVTFTSHYSYDTHGNIIRETLELPSGAVNVISSRDITYYDDGTIKEIINYAV